MSRSSPEAKTNPPQITYAHITFDSSLNQATENKRRNSERRSMFITLNTPLVLPMMLFEICVNNHVVRSTLAPAFVIPIANENK